MMRPNNAIARPGFMKLSETMTVVIRSCKLMLKTVFIAKHVILKTHHKILSGLAQKAEVGLITPICEGGVGQFKNIFTGKRLFDSTAIIPNWEEMVSPITCWSNLSIFLWRRYTIKLN